MPGSKRRALKKLLSPQSSPSQTPIPASTNAQSLPPLAAQSSSSLSSSSISTSPKQSHSNSHFSLFGLRKSPSNSTSMDTQNNIGSNPNNYMSDEALRQDLVVEEMIEREKEIGANHANGVNLQPGVGGNAPPPPPRGGDIPPPPPPNTGGAAGGTYKPTPQQVTAEQLMFGDGNGDGNGKGKKKSSKQRFAERQARRQHALLNSAPPSDPAWTAQLEKERMEEIKVISEACDVLGREIYEIAPDGHCMFNAIGDQLHLIGLVTAQEAQNPHFTRQTAAKYMLAHPDDFMPFLPSITGEDSVGATDDGIMTQEQFQKYCRLVAETGEWGGEPEIQALSRVYSIPIHVIQRGPPTIVSHGGSDDSFGGSLTPQQSVKQGERVVRISYHKRMYGLGEHYNSLRVAE